ncbi:pilus assembly protein PilP [Cycloclasticus pugetii]|jgi:type IV pilus assembly protein PilP|uniref:pilus assembly protein PilP n=1 Tax=Cycloclasticus pugetii TaxID=34068 RepID=UPI00035D47A2|nr:pilus assembly protein PilP [Cycloclasticus pugetii]
MMARLKLNKLLILIMLTLLMGGCVSEEFDDLKAYISQVKSKPATPIEPMPVIKSYESYSYVADGLRNPFEKLDEPQAIEKMMNVEGPGPDLEREKEELEAYPLDTLRMVGTLSKDNEQWALVKANDGVIHRVQAGNYLGQNFGKIIRIQDQQIDLAEWVATTAGKWREREASLALVE